MPKSNKVFMFILLALAMLLLSACSFETHIYIQKKERWRVEEKLEFPKNLGRMGVSVEGLGISIPLDTELPFTMAFNQIVQMCPTYSWQCELHKSSHGSEIRYRLVVKGQGYDSFARFFNLSDETFSGEMKEQGGDVEIPKFLVEKQDGRVHLSSSGGMDIKDTAMAAAIGTVFPVKVAVHGGKILSSNADEVKGGTAIWHSEAY